MKKNPRLMIKKCDYIVVKFCKEINLQYEN